MWCDQNPLVANFLKVDTSSSVSCNVDGRARFAQGTAKVCARFAQGSCPLLDLQSGGAQAARKLRVSALCADFGIYDLMNVSFFQQRASARKLRARDCQAGPHCPLSDVIILITPRRICCFQKDRFSEDLIGKICFQNVAGDVFFVSGKHGQTRHSKSLFFG